MYVVCYLVIFLFTFSVYLLVFFFIRLFLSSSPYMHLAYIETLLSDLGLEIQKSKCMTKVNWLS